MILVVVVHTKVIIIIMIQQIIRLPIQDAVIVIKMEVFRSGDFLSRHRFINFLVPISLRLLFFGFFFHNY